MHWPKHHGISNVWKHSMSFKFLCSTFFSVYFAELLFFVHPSLWENYNENLRFHFLNILRQYMTQNIETFWQLVFLMLFHCSNIRVSQTTIKISQNVVLHSIYHAMAYWLLITSYNYHIISLSIHCTANMSLEKCISSF